MLFTEGIYVIKNTNIRDMKCDNRYEMCLDDGMTITRVLNEQNRTFAYKLGFELSSLKNCLTVRGFKLEIKIK